jgi:tRNA (guanine37-N1)-methyltransferase
VGDAVLAGGEAAALLILEACVRLLPGVLGNAQSLQEESFAAAGGLEHPQYTRPAVFEGREIPAALTSGNHGEVVAWRTAAARRLTQQRRPDLKKYCE